MISKVIRKVLLVSSQLKLNPIEIARSSIALPRFISDYIIFKFKLTKKWEMRIFPALLDKNQQSANLGEYFWQDFFVAKEIISHDPIRHVDVGSRIDGFIAHLACVRKVEVFDIRPLSAQIENVEFTQWDITDPNPALKGAADCVSCLHTLEHIGLGRYGDKLDSDGWKIGLKSLVDLVAPGGGLWLSVPIGIQRVEFNAHRVFNPLTIIHSASELGVALQRFFYLTDAGFIESANIASDALSLSSKNYCLGIFFFSKGSNGVTK